MNILNRAKNIWNLSSKSNPFNSPYFGETSMVARNEIRGTQDEIAAYGGHATYISACTDAITRDVISQGWDFKNPSTGEIVDERRVPKNIIAPYNGRWHGIGFIDLLKTVIPGMILTGNGYVWNIKGTALGMANDVKDVFIPIPSHKCKPFLNVNGEGIDYYTVTMGGMSYKVLPGDMIHFRQNTVFNPFIGVGNVTKSRLLVEGEVAITEYMNVFLTEAQGSPTLIMLDKTNMEHSNKQRMASMLKDKWSSKILYLNVDDADMIQNSLMSKDIDFVGKRKFDMDAMLAIFGVPRVVLGIPEGSNRSTSSNQIPLYYKSTVNPLIREISRTFTEQHVKNYSDILDFCIEEHASADMTEVTGMVGSGLITPNQGSHMMGQETDWNNAERNLFYLPSNLLPMGGVGKVQDSPAETQPPIIEDGEKLSRKNLNDPRHVDAIVESFNKASNFDRLYQSRFLRRALTSRNNIEDKYVGVISDYYKRTGVAVIGIFKEQMNIKEAASPDDIENAVTLIIRYLDENIQAEKEMLTPLHTSGIQRAISDVNTITGSAVSLTFSNPFVKGAVERLADQITGVLTETTKKDIRKLFARALSEGWNTNTIQDAISDKFSQYQGYRARMIARTEARKAWDAGAEVAYTDIGVKKVDVIGCTQFEWNSDCGKRGIPVHLISSLVFHPNHIGSLAPEEEL